MANIGTSIELYDRLSAPINSMIGAINNLIGAYNSLDNAMDNGFDPAKINEARGMLASAADQVDQLGEQIRQNQQHQQKFNDEVQDGESKILKMVSAYASFQGIQKLVNLSDEYTQTRARLAMIAGEQGDVESLQNKIFAAAQRSRGAYTDMADMVAKISLRTGELFTNDEAIKFAENLNKLYTIAGASQQDMQNSQLQLLQAMGSGVLRGEEFNAVFEAAPNVMQAVAEAMGVPVTKLRDMAAEGKITADIVKNAMLTIPEETLKEFDKMPMTWGQAWTMTMNKLYMASQPVLQAINWMAQYWSVLEPIVMGVATAVGLYTTALLIHKGVQMASNVAKTISTIASIAHGAAITAEMTATTGMTASQLAFNAALYACPLTWILIVIIAVIAVVYAAVAAWNKWKHTSVSAAGIIVGTVTAAVSVIWNIILMLVNLIIQNAIVPLTTAWDTFANFFGNIFNDPVATIIRTFENLANTVLGILEIIANGIDAIFGSNLAGVVQGWKGKISAKADALVEKYGNGTYEEKSNVTEQVQGMLNGLQTKFSWNTTSAFNTGYGWGASAESAISGVFGDGGLDLGDQTAADIAQTAENTGKSADSLEATAEDLKYLKDLAEQEAVNRFTTAEIKVEMNNNNSISSTMDLDGIIDHLTTGVNEAMEKAAEGVHV